ncbi:MAG: DUF1156 domain-containing protein [Deferrisomatales bacterium]
MSTNDLRLIEHGFPCHQVGAETQRERGASSALPPLYFLHVWWARRPLTPSRAAIVASLDPAGTDPETFVRQLGIERVQALVNGEPWTLVGDVAGWVEKTANGAEFLKVDDKVLRRLEKEDERRVACQQMISRLTAGDASLTKDPVLVRWERETRPFASPLPSRGANLAVRRVMGDPAHVNERIAFAKLDSVKAVLGAGIHWDAEDLYGYGRAFATPVDPKPTGLVVLDPTSGGGSIPFEALRLGHTVIANELNPVATTILYATLDYPARFGPSLAKDIEHWGKRLVRQVEEQMAPFYHFAPLPESERLRLRQHLTKCPELLPQFDGPEHDHTGQIFCRQVTCPHCGGQAPLLNTCWLSKEAGDPWGVRVVTDKAPRNGKVRFDTYRVAKGKGPNGEDPDAATVTRGVGQCVHCKQAISGDEIKAQARGESPLGQWVDRLYCVVAVRLEPKLDKKGQPQRYATGERAGEIKTQKSRYFRPPVQRDLDALVAAKARLAEKWDAWEAEGLIPTEGIPYGHRRDQRDGIVKYGITKWLDMFTPRQTLGHLYLVDALRRLTQELLKRLGSERGRAVVTYLQFAIDKGLDYNSRHTRWEFTRGIVKGTFGRHDFSLKWTFGEMIFTGPSSGAAWGLSQVADSYKGMAELALPLHETLNGGAPDISIQCGTAASMPSISDGTIDLVCMDPPYYNNVQYAELSDFFYVWQKRSLKDLYPELFSRRLTDKQNEAIANPARDGSNQEAHVVYERMMKEIFSECRRVVQSEGLMTLMFNHKTQEAWETLTRSLIDSGWTITASFPVESESGYSTHQMNVAAAASSIFLSCRKRQVEDALPSAWTGLGGRGVQARIRTAVEEALVEFEPLKLNPVDEMVASYGRALRVLSESWPVMDGDEPVGPIRAMNEASRVVAENQIRRITQGRLSVDDLDPETGMALTVYGIWGLGECSYDEVLNLSRSLNIRLEGKAAGYRVEGAMIGINQEAGGRGRRAKGASADGEGYHAPLVRSGSKLRIATPEERDARRLGSPQTDWDRLHGALQAYREGDVPLARGYLQKHAADRGLRILDLLRVWATEMPDPAARREAEMLLFGLQAV